MYQLTPRMQQNLRQYLTQYHNLFDGGRCSGWQLEELIHKSIQSDYATSHHSTWQEGGHDDQADIRVRTNGEIYPLQIKSGEIKQIKSGDEKEPHLVLSGHRMSRFKGDFQAITEYLNEERSDFLSVPYRKVEDDRGRHHIYRIVYIEGIYLRQLNPDQWEKIGASWKQINPYNVIFTVTPSMSWQVWWRIPLSLVNHTEEFRIR